MGTYTAQILIGNEDPYHGGIQPIHQIFLKENDRAKLELWELNNANPTAIWFPTVNNIIDDALLMIAVHICKDKNLINTAKNFCGKSNLNEIEMEKDFNSTQRQNLYKMCKNIKIFPEKIIFSIFDGSSFHNQLNIIKKYPLKNYMVLT